MPAWSGLFDGSGLVSGSYSLLINKPPRRYAAKRIVNREQFRVLTALFNGLIGAASGSNVTATHKRIQAQTTLPLGNIGGLRTIETVTDINRNTAAADVTALKEIMYNVKTRPSYPKDLSGNGGPALT